MAKRELNSEMQRTLREYVETSVHPELIATYLYYVEQKCNLHPVLFLRDKLVFQSEEKAVNTLEVEGKLWRETEIKIGYVTSSVNEATKKIYICPFTGKVFGDNTHPNPQDAIYDWVAKCPENTERVGGLKVKRFFISEDPEVISAYASKNKPKTPIIKTVFSSAINGKLFHSKEAVVEDFRSNYLKRISLYEIQSQSKFQIDPAFLSFIQEHLAEDKIAGFVEVLSDIPAFASYVEQWIGEVEEEA
jgi:hypothetical protein